ncbi:hypothetical protein EVG20_g11505 [Dentipellis fragilis]|uniref:Uncharacterized protein n=1 Tax=Dentipellis fragilis TaxID=205917 RepID=A0A4Y9XMA0_9AGAM|nr:hypothetical protein EVG20_g11505 [Dentipellis fragilis]
MTPMWSARCAGTWGSARDAAETWLVAVAKALCDNADDGDVQFKERDSTNGFMRDEKRAACLALFTDFGQGYFFLAVRWHGVQQLLLYIASRVCREGLMQPCAEVLVRILHQALRSPRRRPRGKSLRKSPGVDTGRRKLLVATSRASSTSWKFAGRDLHLLQQERPSALEDPHLAFASARILHHPFFVRSARALTSFEFGSRRYGAYIDWQAADFRIIASPARTIAGYDPGRAPTPSVSQCLAIIVKA